MTTIESVLIANRGEIACRIARTCRRLGLRTIAVFSDADADALHVTSCDIAVRLAGVSPADTYLRHDLLVAAALRTRADAVHPGYGFLAESPVFARAVVDAGLCWIGPTAKTIEVMGSKTAAKSLMRSIGVPVLADVTLTDDAPLNAEAVAALGYPVLVKASAGGGGRGMRIVRRAPDLEEAVDSGRHEAGAAFGDPTVFVERYVERGRHIEVQLFGDTHGTVVALGERECSIQRRHQKIIEESPSPAVDTDLRVRLSATAVAAGQAVGYVGAGTVEFLLDPDTGEFAFLEMNTRLQVEHAVTELVTGLDLVEVQLRVAQGAPLAADVVNPTFSGHAIEARLTAEDPAEAYRPATGTFSVFDIDTTTVRVDSGMTAGAVVTPYYDSLVAKVIAHADHRADAITVLGGALRRARLVGPTTNRDQLLNILDDARFRAGDIHTGLLDEDPLATPRHGDLAAAAIAIWFAELAREAAASPVLHQVSAGWRNNPAVARTMTLVAGDQTLVVADAMRRDGVEVDGAPVPARLVAVELDPPSGTQTVRVETDGIRRRHAVTAVGTLRHVATDDGHVVFDLLPRHPVPRPPGRAGSLHALMPGNVRRILVAAGDDVVAGQPVIVLEAMKMEHPVTAPADGRVAAVHVTLGQQVEAGTALVELET